MAGQRLSSAKFFEVTSAPLAALLELIELIRRFQHNLQPKGLQLTFAKHEIDDNNGFLLLPQR